jgi:hypothetical protein
VDATGATQQITPTSEGASVVGNQIINGNFQINQRDPSLTGIQTSASPIAQYYYDRWYCEASVPGDGNTSFYTEDQLGSIGLVGTEKAAAIRTPGAYTLPGYFFRMTQLLEFKWAQFQTQDMVLSLRVGGYGYTTGETMNITVSVVYSDTGTMSGTWTTVASKTISQPTIPLTKVSLNVPGTFSSYPIAVQVTATSNARRNVAAYFTDVQLEAGDVATPYRWAGGSYAGEYMLCQRFYAKVSGTTETPSAIAIGTSTTFAAAMAFFPVTMRTTPTVVLYSYAGTANKVSAMGAADFGTSVTARNVTPNSISRIQDSGAGFTVGQAYWYSYTADAEIY